VNSAAETISTGPTSNRPFHVLVVDDDDMMAEYVALELAALGCECTIAADGEEAIRMLRQDTAFVITDRRMPGMDGIELVTRLRQSQGSGEHLRIAMMTSRGDDEVIRQALKAGVDDFLFKPIDTLQLELAIASAKRFAVLHRNLARRNRLISEAHGQIRETLRRVRTDIAAAAELHRRLLPREDRLPAIDFALLYQPAETIGGDTIGASSVGPGQTLFFILDVVGHGVPAALDSFHLHHRLKQISPRTPVELQLAASRLNAEILERDDDSYATLVCVLADANTQTASIITAGHPPPILLQGENTVTVQVEPSHPLGWFAESQYRTTQIAFGKGDSIAIYSDGLSDLIPGDGGDAISRLFAETSHVALKDMPIVIGDRLRAISGADAPEDDVSLLIVSPSETERVVHDR